jgi:hypothetical protein
MAELAAHLTDHVLPHLPIRQWVLHRFGSSLNVHPHFHVVVLDGVFSRRDDAVQEADGAGLGIGGRTGTGATENRPDHLGAVGGIRSFESGLDQEFFLLRQRSPYSVACEATPVRDPPGRCPPTGPAHARNAPSECGAE